MGLALANTLAGLEAGAEYADVSVLGLGERTGITDLASLVECLERFYGIKTNVNFKGIPKVYQYVSAVAGISIPPFHPILGIFARTHKAGTHQKAVLKDPSTYEIIEWDKYGLKRNFEFGAMQSKELIEELLKGYEVSKEDRNKIVDEIREISMRKGRPLRRSEVCEIVKKITGISLPLTGKGESLKAILFLKVKVGADEETLKRNISKLLLNLNVSYKIQEITGEWDYLITLAGIENEVHLNEIIDRIRMLDSKSIEATSTSIILDEYK